MGFRSVMKRGLAPIFAPFYAGRGSILMLHRVLPEMNTPRIHNTINEISPGQLDVLIRFYKTRGVDIISLDDVVTYLSTAGKKRFVCFTFDDGFSDNLHHALPIFEKHAVPFNIYITTGLPDGTFMIWWYLLEDILLKDSYLEFCWGDTCHKYDLPSLEEKEKAFNEIRRIIIDTPYHLQREYLQAAFQGRHFVEHTKKLALSWEEIKRLSDHPLVTIGAHTINHPALNQLSAEEIEEELIGSKKRIESKTLEEVRHFSYPFGSASEVNHEEFKTVKEFGFQTVTTTRFGNIFREHLHYLERLPRVAVTPATTLEYLDKVNTGRAQFLKGIHQRVVVN